MWLKAPSGGRLLIILNPFESCTRSSSVSSESQGTPAPLKSLLRDHNVVAGKEDKILKPQLKSRTQWSLTVVQAAPMRLHPICPIPASVHVSVGQLGNSLCHGPGQGNGGKMPVLLLRVKTRVVRTVVSTGKKLKPLSKLSKCLAFALPSVTHPRALVEKVFSLQN